MTKKAFKLGNKSAKWLKTIHLVCVGIWFGGVMTWFPLVYGADLTDFDSTYTTYLNMRSIAWNVIGWGGIGSLITGLMNGLLTNWGIFKYRWVTIKFFTVIGLILFGMFFLEDRMLSNLELLENGSAGILTSPEFLRNHILIRYGLIFEAIVFFSIISLSVFKPWTKKRSIS